MPQVSNFSWMLISLKSLMVFSCWIISMNFLSENKFTNFSIMKKNFFSTLI